jgi:hypothetical protein
MAKFIASISCISSTTASPFKKKLRPVIHCSKAVPQQNTHLITFQALFCCPNHSANHTITSANSTFLFSTLGGFY